MADTPLEFMPGVSHFVMHPMPGVLHVFAEVHMHICALLLGGGSEGDRGQAAISKFPNQNNLVLKQQFRRSSGPHTALPAFELSPLVSS